MCDCQPDIVWLSFEEREPINSLMRITSAIAISWRCCLKSGHERVLKSTTNEEFDWKTSSRSKKGFPFLFRSRRHMECSRHNKRRNQRYRPIYFPSFSSTILCFVSMSAFDDRVKYSLIRENGRQQTNKRMLRTYERHVNGNISHHCWRNVIESIAMNRRRRWKRKMSKKAIKRKPRFLLRKAKKFVAEETRTSKFLLSNKIRSKCCTTWTLGSSQNCR